MKQYEIEIYGSQFHGHFGKRHFKHLNMILSHDTIAKVKDFALDIIAGFTYKEVYGENPISYGGEFVPIGNGKEKYVAHTADEQIGYENAERDFTIKARVFRG